MKVLIDNEWKEFEVEFGEAMPEEIGGVEIFPSEDLEETIWADIDQEPLKISVAAKDFRQMLLVQYVHYGTLDMIGYSAQFSPSESDTYANQLG